MVSIHIHVELPASAVPMSNPAASSPWVAVIPPCWVASPMKPPSPPAPPVVATMLSPRPDCSAAWRLGGRLWTASARPPLGVSVIWMLPVADNVVRCSECHVTIFQDRKQGVYSGPSKTCFQCHRRMIGPYPFQHQATVDYSTEEGGCMNCHAPHGSANPRILRQPYDLTNQALCNACHSVPLHQNNNFHGTQWAGVPCSDCHVDIHGSYDNRNLLDPSLQVPGCFDNGCHAY